VNPQLGPGRAAGHDAVLGADEGDEVAEQPWYVDAFDDDYLRVFEPFLPPERTAGEVNGIVELLGLAPGARLLDLCCRPPGPARLPGHRP
jgi:hypothetical protein